MRDKISSAQSHAKAAKDSIAAGKLDEANNQIDALTDELLNAQKALNTLEKTAGVQTNELNRSNDEKNKALLSASEAARRYHRLKFPVCLLGAGAALFFLMRFRLLAFLPPPYSFIGIAAVPTLVFGALWLRL